MSQDQKEEQTPGWNSRFHPGHLLRRWPWPSISLCQRAGGSGATPILGWIVEIWGTLSQCLCWRSVRRWQLRSVVLDCYVGTHWVERQVGGTFLSPLIFWRGAGEESAQMRAYLCLFNFREDVAIKHIRKTNGYVPCTQCWHVQWKKRLLVLNLPPRLAGKWGTTIACCNGACTSVCDRRETENRWRQTAVLCLYNHLVACGVHSGNYKDHHRSALSPISQEGKWRYPWVGGGSKAAGVAHEVWAQACISLMTNQPYFCSLCLFLTKLRNLWVVERTWIDNKWNLRDTTWIQTVGCGQTAWPLKEFTTGRTETVCSNWGWPYTKSSRQLS